MCFSEHSRSQWCPRTAGGRIRGFGVESGVCSSGRRFWGPCCVPGTVLGSGSTRVNKTRHDPPICEAGESIQMKGRRCQRFQVLEVLRRARRFSCLRDATDGQGHLESPHAPRVVSRPWPPPRRGGSRLLGTQPGRVGLRSALIGPAQSHDLPLASRLATAPGVAHTSPAPQPGL